MITLSFVFFGLVAFIATRILFENTASNFATIGRYWEQASFQHGIPVGAGLITFFALQLRTKTILWADEVLAELFKVVFPSKKDTVALAIVCSILIILSGVVLGFFDYVATYLVRAVISLKV